MTDRSEADILDVSAHGENVSGTGTTSDTLDATHTKSGMPSLSLIEKTVDESSESNCCTCDEKCLHTSAGFGCRGLLDLPSGAFAKRNYTLEVKATAERGTEKPDAELL